MSDNRAPYPTKWDIHKIPKCKSCGTAVPYTYMEKDGRKYYLPREYLTDGTDGWHIVCPGEE